jgi:hypothetical protein
MYWIQLIRFKDRVQHQIAYFELIGKRCYSCTNHPYHYVWKWFLYALCYHEASNIYILYIIYIINTLYIYIYYILLLFINNILIIYYYILYIIYYMYIIYTILLLYIHNIYIMVQTIDTHNRKVKLSSEQVIFIEWK